MIEPTESESKAELDRYVDALIRFVLSAPYLVAKNLFSMVFIVIIASHDADALLLALCCGVNSLTGWFFNLALASLF
jgi:hypothetical protein